MGTAFVQRLALAGLLALSAGCAGVAPLRGTGDIDKQIAERGVPQPAWPVPADAGDREAQWLDGPLSLSEAITLAFQRNPAIRSTYAELGIAQADVVEASRFANPTFGYARLAPNGAGRDQVTMSFSIGFTDWLLMPSRRRIASLSFESERERMSSQLLQLRSEVEKAWFGYVSALQVAEMRKLVADAAAAGGEYAERLFDAGNISRRQLALEQAAAGDARIGAIKAAVDAASARAELASLMGISMRESWNVASRLPAPPATDAAPDDIAQQAMISRLDVSAARHQISALDGGLRMTRRWRWLADIELGYERERESDGARISGPTLAWQIPLFNRNDDGVLRSESNLEIARARLSELELAVQNDVALGLARLNLAREIAETYGASLVPARETVVEQTQLEHNYMLVGAFELLEAKRQQFDAYQGYLESVRDYWVARAQLREAAGGVLPGDDRATEPTLGVEAVLPAPSPAPVDHSKTEHSSMDHSQMNHPEMDHTPDDSKDTAPHATDHSQMDHSTPSPGEPK